MTVLQINIQQCRIMSVLMVETDIILSIAVSSSSRTNCDTSDNVLVCRGLHIGQYAFNQ